MKRKRDDGYPKATPLWVIDEITRLKRSVEYWKSQLRSQVKGETEVGYDWYGTNYGKRQHLPEGAEVWFQIHEDYPITARVTAQGLEVRSAGVGSLNVRPVASNVVIIRQEEL